MSESNQRRPMEGMNVEHAFDPEARRAQQELDDFAASRPYQDESGTVHDPENGQFINSDNHFDQQREQHYEESLEANSYDNMSMSELARKLGEAELAKDKTMEDDLIDVLLEKIDLHVEKETSSKREERLEDLVDDNGNPNYGDGDSKGTLPDRHAQMMDRIIHIKDKYKESLQPESPVEVNFEDAFEAEQISNRDGFGALSEEERNLNLTPEEKDKKRLDDRNKRLNNQEKKFEQINSDDNLTGSEKAVLMLEAYDHYKANDEEAEIDKGSDDGLIRVPVGEHTSRVRVFESQEEADRALEEGLINFGVNEEDDSEESESVERPVTPEDEASQEPITDPSSKGMKNRFGRIINKAKEGYARIGVGVQNAQQKTHEYFHDEKEGKRRRITRNVIGAAAVLGTAYLIYKNLDNGDTGPKTMGELGPLDKFSDEELRAFERMVNYGEQIRAANPDISVDEQARLVNEAMKWAVENPPSTR